MSYRYEDEKPRIFTEDNQKLFLKIRDDIRRMLDATGAIRLEEAVLIRNVGDSWTMLACVDRLVELGEIREIKQGDCAAQDRIFVKV